MRMKICSFFGFMKKNTTNTSIIVNYNEHKPLFNLDYRNSYKRLWINELKN